MGAKYVGAEVRRREDARLLIGRGRYVDDLRPFGCLHAAILRSPHAHARIRRIGVDRARGHPAVVACFTYADLAPPLRPLPQAGAPPPLLQARIGFDLKTAAQLALAHERVRYVGEPVAVIVAADPYAAEDALELIEVDYEPLPAVVDVEAGLTPGAPLLHPEWGDNVGVAFTVRIGDPERALADAPVRVGARIRVPRYAGMPMEPRGIVAEPAARGGGLTVWASTQVPHWLQRTLCEMLDLPAHKLRVVAPEVGGGFGTKASIYQEDVLIPVIAARLDRPVKWIETRREHLQSATHSREQLHDAELGASRDGLIVAFRDRFLLDLGAYNPWGIVQPYNTVGHTLGPHRIRNALFEGRAVVTNKTPHAPYRGAGRPEAVFVMDRLLDMLARETGLDPGELRRRNLVRPDEMPYDVGMLYRDGNPLVYDGGDFPDGLARALRAADYHGVRAEQAGLRARGIYRGVGISSYVEGTGIGPYEGATVRLDASGKVLVATGACSQGQGHETAYAQIAADALGVGLEDITVIGGDTEAIPFGIGTFASRSTVLAGNAVAASGGAVRAKLVRAAARLLEAAEADLEVEAGRVFVRGSPGRALTFASIVRGSLPTFQAPGAVDPDFEATTYQGVPTVTYASAVHVAVVEVDPETGSHPPAPLRRGPRLRPRDQPDAGGRADPRRRRPGGRWGPRGGDRLRLGRPAPHGLADGLRPAAGRRAAVHRDGPPRASLAAQPARGQGRRGRGRHLAAGRPRQRDRGRPVTVRRAHHRGPGHAGPHRRAPARGQVLRSPHVAFPVTGRSRPRPVARPMPARRRRAPLRA